MLWSSSGSLGAHCNSLLWFHSCWSPTRECISCVDNTGVKGCCSKMTDRNKNLKAEVQSLAHHCSFQRICVTCQLKACRFFPQVHVVVVVHVFIPSSVQCSSPTFCIPYWSFFFYLCFSFVVFWEHEQNNKLTGSLSVVMFPIFQQHLMAFSNKRYQLLICWCIVFNKLNKSFIHCDTMYITIYFALDVTPDLFLQSPVTTIL